MRTITPYLLFCFILLSCQKESSDIQEMAVERNLSAVIIPTELLNQEGFQIQKGSMRFESMDAFNQIMSILHQSSQLQINAWLEKVDDFMSYREIQQASSVCEWIIEDPIYASVVNSDGYIVIGEYHILTTYNNEYVLKSNAYEEVSYKEIVNKGQIQKIERKQIQNHKFSGWLTENKSYWPAESRNADLEAWNSSYFAYASFGIKLTNFQGSSKDEFDYCEISGTAKWKQSTEPTYHTDSYNNIEEHEKVNKIVMGWVGGLAVSFDVDYIDADYHLEERCSGQYKTFDWAEYWN